MDSLLHDNFHDGNFLRSIDIPAAKGTVSYAGLSFHTLVFEMLCSRELAAVFSIFGFQNPSGYFRDVGELDGPAHPFAKERLIGHTGKH